MLDREAFGIAHIEYVIGTKCSKVEYQIMI